MPHDSILSTTFVLISKDLTKISDTYNLDYASSIGSLIYLSYTRPDIIFSFKSWQNTQGNLKKAHVSPYSFSMLHQSSHTALGFTYYADMIKSPVYQLIKENAITPSIHMFTFCDSTWDDGHVSSRRSGVLLIFYQVEVVNHSSSIPEPVATISDKAEYNEACMAMNHTEMTLNHIQEVEDKSK
jgi:hypothetical protein